MDGIGVCHEEAVLCYFSTHHFLREEDGRMPKNVTMPSFGKSSWPNGSA